MFRPLTAITKPEPWHALRYPAEQSTESRYSIAARGHRAGKLKQVSGAPSVRWSNAGRHGPAATLVFLTATDNTAVPVAGGVLLVCAEAAQCRAVTEYAGVQPAGGRRDAPLTRDPALLEDAPLIRDHNGDRRRRRDCENDHYCGKVTSPASQHADVLRELVEPAERRIDSAASNTQTTPMVRWPGAHSRLT